MKPPLNVNSADDFQTPPVALKPLIPYLKKGWTIWECACGKGNLVNEFTRLGFNVVGTDILQSLHYNFLFYQPDFYDCIVTNPPYSQKQRFLERCYAISKPFALLLPLTTFETYNRQKLFKRYGLEVILFDKRINFHTPTGNGSGSWFATAWFTNWLNIGKQLTFTKLDGKEDNCLEFSTGTT